MLYIQTESDLPILGDWFEDHGLTVLADECRSNRLFPFQGVKERSRPGSWSW